MEYEIPLKHPHKPRIQAKRRKPTPKPKILLDLGCREIKTLYGPIELDILDRPDGARIVLLGDMHVSRRKCPSNTKCAVSIWTYLEKLFQEYHGADPIDFFLEIAFMDEDEEQFPLMDAKRAAKYQKHMLTTGQPYRDNIGSVQAYFYDCWQRTKTRCPYNKKRSNGGQPTVRFHYSDIRGGVIHSNSELEDQTTVKIMRELLAVPDDSIGLKHKNILLLLIEKFINSDIKYFFRLTKIDKQINGIRDKDFETNYGLEARDIRYELHQWVLTHINKVRDYAVFVKTILQEMVQLKTTVVVRNALNEDAFHFLVHTGFMASSSAIRFGELSMFTMGALLSPLFDVYTVARMLKLNMRNVIVFAGAMHTDRIRVFLMKHLLYRSKVSVISRNQNKNFQCISLKGVPQPWFQ